VISASRLTPALELKRRYLRQERLPMIFCPGCGIGVALKYVLWALEESGLEEDKVVWVSGIGCSSRVPGYVNFDSLHTTHGRALAFATGIKLANPELKVIAFMGDGDAIAIGGNHLIHAARRNLDVTTIIVNNFNYGMTGGQIAPSTPHLYKGSSAPYGNYERPFDISALVASAGANYVARWTILEHVHAVRSIKKALLKQGFALVELLVPCPTYFGRRNGMRRPIELLRWLRENTVHVSRAQKMSQEELKGKIVIGEIVDRNEPGLVQMYMEYVKRAKLAMKSA